MTAESAYVFWSRHHGADDDVGRDDDACMVGGRDNGQGKLGGARIVAAAVVIVAAPIALIGFGVRWGGCVTQPTLDLLRFVGVL